MASATDPSKPVRAPAPPASPAAPVEDDREHFGGFSDRTAPLPTPDPQAP